MGGSVVSGEGGPLSPSVGWSDMVEFLVNNKIVEIEKYHFLGIGREWMFRKSTSKYWSVVCMVRIFSK